MPLGDEFDQDEEEHDPSHHQSFRKQLSEGSKAILSKVPGWFWSSVTAKVDSKHHLLQRWNKPPPVKALGIKMHHTTSGRSSSEGGLPATYGKVTFNQDLERQKQKDDALFACLCADTDPAVVQRLLLEHWKLKRPSVIISVTGSAQDIVLDSGLEQMVKQGIARAASATDAWTFTGGMDVGVMSLVADALAQAKISTPVIGVAPYHRITDNHRFFHAERDTSRVQRGQGKRRVHYVKRTPNSYASAALDEQHTHFLLVDAGAEKKDADWGSEIPLRVKVEDKLCESLRVPRVLLVLQGGRGTFKTVLEMLQSNSPVVLIKESKGCAQAVSEFVEPLLRDKALYTHNVELLKNAVEERMNDPEFDERFREVLEEKWWVGSVKPFLREIGTRLELLHVFTLSEVHKTPFDMAVLKAIVSSFKQREDKEAAAETRMLRNKKLRALVPTEREPHQNARTMGQLEYVGKRIQVSDEQVPWAYEFRTGNPYSPSEYTADVVLRSAAGPAAGFSKEKWADLQDLRGPAVQAGYESLEAEVRARTTYVNGEAKILEEVTTFEPETGRPINPAGRTGMRGRGLLGRWGPNQAADPIVTRYQGCQLQMVAVRRKDTGEWAIPGGMVDAKEGVSTTLVREFKEEAGAFTEASEKARFEQLTEQLFANGELVYRGYVDEPRNTDNAWIETTAYHFHCNDELAQLSLKAGDDARDVTWLDIDVSKENRYRDLYASHRDWVDRIAEQMQPHTIAREEFQLEYKKKRVAVPSAMVPWSKALPSYQPQEFTAPECLKEWEANKVAGWADPPHAREVPDLHARKSYEGPITFDERGAPQNPRGRTGLRGRGLLGKWGPNFAADPIVTRYHPQSGRLQVVLARRQDTGQLSIPGGIKGVNPGDKWHDQLKEPFESEVRDSDEDQMYKQYFANLLQELFDGEESKVVYRGYVDDTRNTDNAWLETTAYHFHCSRELGALLPLQPAPPELTQEQKQQIEREGKVPSKLVNELGLNEKFWVDVEEAANELDIWASHRDWLVVVRNRLRNQKEHPGLLQLVVQWGRMDIAESVLKDSDLLAQRQPTQVQMAFQQGLKRATDPNFDVRLIELLMEHGAKAADVYLPELLELEDGGHFGILSDIARRPRRLFSLSSLRNKKSGSKESIQSSRAKKNSKENVMGPESEASAGPSLKNSRLRRASRAILQSNTVAGELGERRSSRKPTEPAEGAASTTPEETKRSRTSRARLLAGQGTEAAAGLTTPWRRDHARFMNNYVKGFTHYATQQHALHNVDLMFWAILAGALELAEFFWKRCRSPLRAALIAQDILGKIQLKGRRTAAINEELQWFNNVALGVLDNLPDMETARRLLQSKESDFATLGAPGKVTESILQLAISFGNKDFVSHRYCQDILDEMWWGRTERSGRVCCKAPFPPWYSCYLQVFLPMFRVLPVVPNDLCVGYPWLAPEELQRGQNQVVTLTGMQAITGIWHIPRMKRAVFSISSLLFSVLFVIVFLDRLCGPLHGTRGVCFWTLVVWNFANLLQECLQASIDQRAWRSSKTNFQEIAVILLLFIACGLRFRLSQLRETSSVAEDLASWLNLISGGRIRPVMHSTGRSEEEKFRSVWINIAGDPDGHELGQCPWSLEIEFLRFVLAFAAPLLVLSLTQFLTMSSSVGVLMVCTWRMLKKDLLPWLLFASAVLCGSAFSLNILAPTYQLEAGAGAFKPFGGQSWGPTELDLSAGGPFFATLWGLFGFYEPAELATATGSSFAAPVFMWIYLMLIAVVFINLLIAMFNQTYNNTHEAADEEWKMKRVDAVQSYMRLYPVPPPLNLVALVWDVILRVLGWMRHKLGCSRRNRTVMPGMLPPPESGASVFVDTSSNRVSRRDGSAPRPKFRHPAVDRHASFATGGEVAALRSDEVAPTSKPSDGRDLRPALSKNADAAPNDKMRSELQQQLLLRQNTRMRLLSKDSTLQKGSFSLFDQVEAERAEDQARHGFLQSLLKTPHLSTAMGKKEDQILAAVRKMGKEGGEMHEKIRMLFDKVEKLELKNLEDRQTTTDKTTALELKLYKLGKEKHPHADSSRRNSLSSQHVSPRHTSSSPPHDVDATEATSKLNEAIVRLTKLTEELAKTPHSHEEGLHAATKGGYLSKAAHKKAAPQQLPPLPTGGQFRPLPPLMPTASNGMAVQGR